MAYRVYLCRRAGWFGRLALWSSLVTGEVPRGARSSPEAPDNPRDVSNRPHSPAVAAVSLAVRVETAAPPAITPVAAIVYAPVQEDTNVVRADGVSDARSSTES